MKNISSKLLAPLPLPATLLNICKSLATLDAIICPDWEYRYYSFYRDWDKSNNEQFFQMRDGSGDEFQIVFTSDGAVINGFAHESEMSVWTKKNVKPPGISGKIKELFGWRQTVIEQKIPEGVLDGLPEYYRHIVFEEPIKSSGTTFCIWWDRDLAQWRRGDIDFTVSAHGDGSEDLLYILDGNPATYRKWAIEYYEEQFGFDEKALNLELVEYVYHLKPVTREMALQLNAGINDFDALKKDLDEIGYPYDGL